MPTRETNTLTPEQREAELERGRRIARRRMGRISFVFVLGSVGLILYSLTLGPQPDVVATALAKVETLIIWMLGFPTSLVMTYLGVSMWEQIAKKAKEIVS